LGQTVAGFRFEFAKDAFVCRRKKKMVFPKVGRIEPTRNVRHIGEHIGGFDVAYEGIGVGEA